MGFLNRGNAGVGEHVLPPEIYHFRRKMIRNLTIFCLAALLACSVSQDQEVQLGRQNAQEINAQLPIVTDPAVASYIQTLGESIAKRTSRSDLDWHFYLVNSKQVNAFALPGGYIYVNRGLIEDADHVDELAGTLGHEIGHVIERHSVKDMQTQQKTNLGLAVVCTLTNICHSGLAQAAVQVGGSAYFARHSRTDELEADSEAVVNVTRAGYDPRGVPELFDALLKQREYQPTVVEGWFADHPLEETRIQRARNLIARLKVDPAQRLIVDTQGFQAFKTRVSELPAPPPPPPQASTR